MKLSLRINGSEEPDGDNSTSTDYPDIKNYEAAGKILERELEEIYPAAKNYEFAEISLSFVDAAEIRELNKTYRDVDEPTDVLSFPLMENEPVGIPKLPVLALGDIVICPEETQRLHPDLNLREGIVLMIAHSFLHLLGFDHDMEEREKIMWDMQEKISREILEVLA